MVFCPDRPHRNCKITAGNKREIARRIGNDFSKTEITQNKFYKSIALIQNINTGNIK